MKSLVFCLALPLAAAGVEISQLGVPEFLDTEVSTNIPFEVSFDSMSRMNFSISERAMVEGKKPGAALIVQ